SQSWKKIKTGMEQEFIICGYTAPSGSRIKFGSLVLGVYDSGKLKCIGHCGTGFTEDILAFVYNKMQSLKQSKCPFDEIPKVNAKVTWIKPKLVCEIKFAQFTNEQQLRNAVFKGLRTDKDPREIKIEIPETSRKSNRLVKPRAVAAVKKVKQVSKKIKSDYSAKKVKEKRVAVNQKELEIKIKGFTVRVSNPGKIYWPKEKYTKGDLLEYYKNIASVMLPYLKDRPHALNRYPNGIDVPGFYQKDVEPEQMPEYIKTLKVHSESGNKNIDYVLCQNEASLLYMANLGCIEINPWNSRQKKIGNPDWVVIDLDPGDNTFRQVVKTALVTKKIFDAIGVDCYAKTSGATGIHIYAPAGAKYDYDHIKNFAELIANIVHHELPDITSIERSPAKRKKQIYIDFLQNRRGQTLAAPYCVRPKPGATVSTPLKWEEVDADLNPSQFTMFNMLDRVNKIGDIWKPVLGKGLNMEKAIKAIEKL
ncbi:MAG: DNA ligase D, partial [Chitinophagales bacterium]